MVSVPDTVAQTAGAASRRPRRWIRRLVAGALAVVVVLTLVVGGIAWYFSDLALAVDHTVSYPEQVLSRAGAAPAPGGTTVRITRDPDTAAPGTVALAWAGGYGRVGRVSSSDAGSVTREFTPEDGGVPAPGTPVRVDGNVYHGDPRSALGLPFTDVRVAGPLGPLPAWWVPAGTASAPVPPAGPAAAGSLPVGSLPAGSLPAGSLPAGSAAAGSTASSGRTWIVFVHGHDGDRQESLRYLRGWHELGYPVLVTTYRDDVGAPSSPDGWHHLGDTEWQDVAASVRWARDHGAADVVLAGWSMGAAIALQTADRSPVSGLIRGLLLDSPVIDWRDVFARQGGVRGLPGPLITVAEQVLQWRSGISLDRLDWESRAAQLTTPTLILHSDSDDYVPDGPAIRLAAARPDLVTLVRIPGARHTLGRNVDPHRYDSAVRDWLTRLRP